MLCFPLLSYYTQISKNSILVTSQLFHYTYYFFKLNSLDIMAISYMYYVSPFIILPCTYMTSQFFIILFFKIDSLDVKSIPRTATKAALAVQNWEVI